jgi:hypothetical protein
MIELSCARSLADEHLGLLKHSRCIQAVSTSSHPLLSAPALSPDGPPCLMATKSGSAQIKSCTAKCANSCVDLSRRHREAAGAEEALTGQFMSAGAHTLGQKVYSHQAARDASQSRYPTENRGDSAALSCSWLLLQIWLAGWLARWKVCKRRKM